ncbi:cortical protein marker for cell polarity domain-containing protein [Pochonia chlamydosporia 170]|uniref:Cortical protein marker for cell polarity domain-containing protein n=1 Tax=Pochonia chlamydosporia 170 TaxID=1380566 RepID=A0A179F9S1_METCM|nr:cortical protein marker for cell polarity domain-containing protein [Pochonia chlamydosporia 170]OAQ61823.1 cortical protein marker for cell polarity domain-containing protein [Pochonia chlamydosporia 170]
MSRNAPSRTLSSPAILYKQSPTSVPGSVPVLAKRDGNCPENSHNCLDVNFPRQCCDNQSYCYINFSNDPRCCPIGSNCIDDSPCKSEHFYCTTTLPSITTGNSTTKGCCGRKCPQTSYYLCPPDLGGNCCPYGSNCQTGGNCVRKYTPSTTLLLPSQSSTRSSTESPPVGEADRLSPGARAGIGVGIALGTSLLIALVAWSFILYKRRRRQVKNHDEDPTNRAELMESIAPQEPSPQPETRTSQEAQTEAEGTTAPLEMASDAAQPPEQERPASPWENGAQVETIDGLFELDASEVQVPGPSLPSPSEPNVYFPSHWNKM